MDNAGKIKSIIEALLIISEEGLTRQELKAAISDADMKDIDDSLETLKKEYGSSGRAFNIAEIAGRCRIVTKPEYLPWISNLYSKEIERLTGPSMETLAILAYKQPATRAEIESVRGVNIGAVLKSLMDRGLIQVKGRKDVIGRPLLYGTTEKFLQIFGLNSLDDLPILREFTEDDLEYGKSREEIEMEDVTVYSPGENGDVRASHLLRSESTNGEIGEKDCKALSNEDEEETGDDAGSADTCSHESGGDPLREHDNTKTAEECGASPDRDPDDAGEDDMV